MKNYRSIPIILLTVLFSFLAFIAYYKRGYTLALINFISANSLLAGISGLIVLVLLVLLFLYRRRITAKTALILTLVAFWVFFTAVGFYKHVNLNTNLFDFALEQQVVWNTSQGRLFASSAEVRNYLGDHFSLITLPVALVYAVFPHALTLFALQSLAVTLAAWAVFRLAKLVLKTNTWAFFWLLIFCANWAVVGSLLFDYHPIVFAMPFILWAMYLFMIKASAWKIFLLLVLASICKEDVGIFVGMFGLYVAIKGRRKLGLLTAVYGFSISLLSLLVIIPQFRGEQSDTLLRFAALGTSPSEILRTIITKPIYTLQYLLSGYKITYVLRLFLPVLFLGFAPMELLIFAPSLLMNLLTNSTAQNSAVMHYDVLIVCGVFFAGIIGMRRLRQLILPKRRYLWIWMITAVALINIFLLFGHPLWRSVFLVNPRYHDYAYLLDLNKRIPHNAILAASNAPGSVFAEREELQIFSPEWIKYKTEPDYIVADKLQDYPTDIQAKLQKLLAQNYEIMEETPSFLVLRRVNP